MAASLLKVLAYIPQQQQNHLFFFPRGCSSRSSGTISHNKRLCMLPVVSMSASPLQLHLEKSACSTQNISIPIMVNGCSGKMGKAVIKAADAAGLHVVPISFGCDEESGQALQVCGREFLVHGPSDRVSVLAFVFDKYPNLIVVDYTVPTAVNDNADLYCKVGVPFVMGTTGGDRDQLRKIVEDSKVYAVISPQMGKQVVAFLAAMEIMAEQFPGAFSGYSLEVMESHQASKVDASGTAKAVISCFSKLGVSFDMDQHNVCGRSIYAEGTIDAVIFLAKKVQSKDSKYIYNMIDVLQEGNMR